MLKRLFREEKGFTLVELLIVMVILAILAMVAVPRFIDMRKEAQASSCRAAQQSLRTGIELYQYYNTLDSTTFPMPSNNTLSDWNSALTKPYSFDGRTIGPFLRAEAKCPGGGNITIDDATLNVKCNLHP